MNAPVFIVGPPRSGTTLLMECLNRHPELSIAPETNFLTAFHGERRWIDLSDEAEVRRLLRRLFDQGYGIGEWAHLEEEVAEGFLARERRDWAGLFQEVGSGIARARGKPRWGEKTPGHARFLPELLGLFPDARVLGTWRRPEAVVSSFLARTDLHDDVDRVVWEILQARRAYARAGEELLEVPYERLVTEPEATLREVARHLSVAWDPAMVEPGVETSSYGPARAGVILRGDGGITPRSLDTWKERLDPAVARRVARLTGEEAGPVARAAFHLRTARSRVGWALRKGGWGGIRRRLRGRTDRG